MASALVTHDKVSTCYAQMSASTSLCSSITDPDAGALALALACYDQGAPSASSTLQHPPLPPARAQQPLQTGSPAAHSAVGACHARDHRGTCGAAVMVMKTQAFERTCAGLCSCQFYWQKYLAQHIHIEREYSLSSY